MFTIRYINSLQDMNKQYKNCLHYSSHEYFNSFHFPIYTSNIWYFDILVPPAINIPVFLEGVRERGFQNGFLVRFQNLSYDQLPSFSKYWNSYIWNLLLKGLLYRHFDIMTINYFFTILFHEDLCITSAK